MPTALAISEVLRNKAVAAGASTWIDALPDLLADLADEWSLTLGKPLAGGTESYVVEATLEDGREAVLKLLVPRGEGMARNEITVLRLAGGEGCAELLRADEGRRALLVERLGPSLDDLALPIERRHEILCAAAMRLWRPAPGCGLPSGAEKGRWLMRHISETWEALGRPCSQRAVDHALACAERRIAAHDDERAVLVHGDVHQWNALQAEDGSFKLIDPDGLLAEAEYDLGVLMREDPEELMAGDPRDRARWLARHTRLDGEAIWEWGVVERVSTGLLCTRIGLQPVGREMLAVADRVSLRQ